MCRSHRAIGKIDAAHGKAEQIGARAIVGEIEAQHDGGRADQRSDLERRGCRVDDGGVVHITSATESLLSRS
jgi:hypothetical protein